ncbi:MAG: thiamine pyrophosphate-dependent enzyme [Thermoplasmata archaeon]|nr:thiamine pyrophosphate-dependent enzyme [Thermoplasmata archaeon]
MATEQAPPPTLDLHTKTAGEPALELLPYTRHELDQSLGPEWPTLLTRGLRWMLLGRALDSRMLALQRQGRIGFYGPATGQEAVSVGAALAVEPDDWVFPGLREQLLALARGHPLPTYVHHLFADRDDPTLGRQMPCHPSARDVNYVSMSSVIGTQISQAVGAAYAFKLKRSKAVALAFFGDGATSANDFHAGLNFAGVFSLPVVFACTNNQWAISVPVARQSHVMHLSDKAKAYGMPGRTVDGTDIVEVYRAFRDAIALARSGGGPTMIEFVLYRMTPHSSSDDPTRYQPADFLARGRAHDPVARLDALLNATGAIQPDARSALANDADRSVRAAIELAERAGPPPPESLMTDVFAPPASAGAR